ncbi:MAG: TonB-dependent receptor [Balneolaceae bacterium]|nr:TonB-dependent receptor [Balneolaceae bacterium]
MPFTSYAQEFQFENISAIEVFNRIEQQTEFSFLYRESLVSDLEISLNTDQSFLVRDLQNSLRPHDLTVRVDSVGRQLIVLPMDEEFHTNQSIRISGQIVDSESGERLPFSTLSWRIDDSLRGLVTDQSARFQIRLQPDQPTVTLEASYVGYKKSTLSLDLSSNEQIRDLTIRMHPEPISGSEIIVLGNNYYSPQDSSLNGLIKTDRFSPLGEDNAVRALQILPSVGTTTAMNDGLNVRGSTPDGFHLELDGITIFNQSHLFGLLDSFNEDAVLNSGFFYDVAPAHIHSPIGGKLSLTTRNGSLQSTDVEAGVSNTSIKVTADGPLKKGKSSWLVSARSSYMNQLEWFNNNHLVRWGLDINRPGSEISSAQNINSELVTPRSSDVYYFDIHGKFNFEQKDGSRTMASLYFGGDRTSQLADRLSRNRPSEEQFRATEVETENRWNNFALSTQHQRSLSTSVYSNTTVALSAYETYFSKDDFLYTNFTRIGESLQTTVFTYPLLNRSTMNRAKLDQTFDLSSEFITLKTGFTGIYHRGEYQENSFDRQQFYTQTSSFQGDLFAQTEVNPYNFLELKSGLRTHFYTAGNYFRFSPRLKANLFEDQNVSLSVGYSKNHQFINRVGFSNAVTADVWILANENQPPSSVNQLTAGLYLKPFRRLYFQAEGYLKHYENLRSHELNAQTLTNTFTDSPWFFDNEGEGKGVEFLSRFRSDFFTLTQTYTLSSMKLRNESINDGEEFLAPWDRTHAATTNLAIEITPNIQLYAAFIIASGSVTGTYDLARNQSERLGPYQRLDLSALFRKELGGSSVTAKFSVFNVLDEQNPWYREYQPVIVTRNTVPAIRSEIVSVYDLGIQPSFEIKIDF